MRFPGKVDVLLNLGNRFGERAAPGTTLMSVRNDPTSLARTAPVDVAMVADLRLAAADLVAAIRGMTTASRLKQIAEERSIRVRAYTKEMAEFRMAIARENADRTPVSLSRIALELDSALAPDTYYVSDADSGRAMNPLMSFGGADKQYFQTSPNILGWAMAAAFGVKLARPDRPVVAVTGDGSFCFSGPQPLWSMARYRAPVMTIVLNNRSYNNERNRIWQGGGRQFKSGRDMTCYNGSPDVDFVKAAAAFGVEGEAVAAPGDLKPAIGRAQRVIADGRPYLVEILTARDGIGTASTWYPAYSIADQRKRRV
jgi:benzoylformate decarboxylase